MKVYTKQRKFYITLLFFLNLESTEIPEDLRTKVADLYLSRYKKIILWGTGVNPTATDFDSVYTDMTWLKVNREAAAMEQTDLSHYTELFVNKSFSDVTYVTLTVFFL